jgi:CBS domain-containing protein
MEIRDITKEAVLISEDATFREAIALMMKKQINSLLVVGENGMLTGEVSVSDLLDAIVPTNLDGDHVITQLGTEDLFEMAVKDASEKEVREFMNTDFQSKDFQFEPGNHKEKDVIWIKFRKEERLIKK